MIDKYMQPLKLMCTGCRGEGKVMPAGAFEQNRAFFERPCDHCRGLGYVVQMIDAGHPLPPKEGIEVVLEKQKKKGKK